MMISYVRVIVNVKPQSESVCAVWQARKVPEKQHAMKTNYWKWIATVASSSPEREIPRWRLAGFMNYSSAEFGGVTARISSRNDANDVVFLCKLPLGFLRFILLHKSHVRFTVNSNVYRLAALFDQMHANDGTVLHAAHV